MASTSRSYPRLVGCRTGRSLEISVFNLPWLYCLPIGQHHVSSFSLQEEKIKSKNLGKLKRLLKRPSTLSVFETPLSLSDGRALLQQEVRRWGGRGLSALLLIPGWQMKS